MRLSNFLLWQLAYAEIYVTPTLWPDFRGLHLLEGIAEYQKRERRYGGLNGDSHAHSSPSGEMHMSMADLAVELRTNGTNSEVDSESENQEKSHHSKLHASKVTRKH